MNSGSRTTNRELRRGVSWALGLLLACSADSVAAGLKLPAVIGDNMVLQQGKKVAIWGAADPGSRVTVSVAGQDATGTADRAGRWKVELGPLSAGGPYDMTIHGAETVTVRNVAVGEVWVASGQSNMEWPVKFSVNPAQEVASADYPMVRMFTVKKAVAGQPQTDVEGQWAVAGPKTAGDFSAVGYFFGRELHRALGVSIGLIHTSWGGTPAEAWTSAPTLASDSDLKPILEDRKQRIASFPKVLEEFRQKLEAWEQEARKAEAEGQRAPTPPELPRDPRSDSWRAAGLYNAMIAPLVPYAIQGAMWYQGESNADRAYQYRKLFRAMIRDWRKAWGLGDFPFLYVQLANFDQSYAPRTAWAELREAQSMALALPKTGMAVALDIGDPYDIHPRNKQEVGRRLALAAQAVAYGRDVVFSGPVHDSMVIEGDRARLRFKHSGGGLVAKDGAPLRGFEVAGEDRKFVPASAQIEGESIVVQSDQVKRPMAVRYGWADNPDCNLSNRAGLPASPFRTDHWPGVTADAPPVRR